MTPVPTFFLFQPDTRRSSCRNLQKHRCSKKIEDHLEILDSLTSDAAASIVSKEPAGFFEPIGFRER